jgi:nucleotide-binding universal stress UspA family protein
MDEKTVVGWDGSAPADAALDWALERERPRNGTIALVRVVDDTQISADYYVTEEAVDAASDELKKEAARLKVVAPGCFVTTTIVRGDPVDELLRFSNEQWVLAVGTEKHRSPHFRYGWSLGARLAAAAAGPVAVIPPKPAEGAASTGVVVGVDASFESQEAIEVAAEEALRRHDELLLVHAWQEPAILAEEYVYDPRLVRGVEEQGERILALASDKIAARFPGLQLRRQLFHAPAELALLESAREAALLVVGTRHLRGMKRLLLGSVSHSVLINIACPTIVVGQVAQGRGAPREAELTDAVVHGSA